MYLDRYRIGSINQQFIMSIDLHLYSRFHRKKNRFKTIEIILNSVLNFFVKSIDLHSNGRKKLWKTNIFNILNMYLDLSSFFHGVLQCNKKTTCQSELMIHYRFEQSTRSHNWSVLKSDLATKRLLRLWLLSQSIFIINMHIQIRTKYQIVQLIMVFMTCK